MIELLILSLVQGVTEFLPISSSSHLILISNYFDFTNQNLSIDVSLHIGSFFAVLFYFRKDIFNFVKNKVLFIKILISSIPVMVFGFLLVEFELIDKLRNLKVISWSTLVFGLLLFISDRFKTINKIDKNFTIKSAMIIGFFQVLSLIPGVSRSGITITAARLLNYKRYDSAKISFLLSIPTLAAITFFGFKSVIEENSLNFSVLNFFSIVLSFLFSFITIKYFLAYIKRFSLKVFVIYRIVLGLILLSFLYL